MTFSVHEAKTQFSKLLDLVEQGEDVVIMRHGKIVAQLVAPPRQGKAVLGGMRNEPSWPTGWDRPLTDEESEAFWNGRW